METDQGSCPVQGAVCGGHPFHAGSDLRQPDCPQASVLYDRHCGKRIGRIRPPAGSDACIGSSASLSASHSVPVRQQLSDPQSRLASGG